MVTDSAPAAFPAPRLKLSSAQLLAAALLAAMAGAFVFPAGAFSIDEAIYIDMAHAMTARGALDITPQSLPDGAAVLGKSDGLVRIINGQVIPQYPSLYAVIAAPFYLLMGVRGLILLNAFSGVLSLWLTYGVARSLKLDEWTARASAILLGAASIFAGYFYAIWPHMTALAFVLAGALAIARAGAGKQPGLMALTAGLVFGFGVGIRVDVILAAIASFFWLRLFARPGDRLCAVNLLIGLAPGLIVNAFLNYQKFGVLNPISYGDHAGSQSVARYAPMAIACAGAALGAFAVNFSQRPWAGIANSIPRWSAAAKAMLAVALLGALWLILPNLVRGLYVLIVDLQAYSGAERAGEIRDPYGYWTFFGLPKKALLQSMPYLPLAALPIAAFLKGATPARASYLLLFAFAPIMFFSLNSWHGGMAYNLRYFLPATPFLVILTAIGWRQLKSVYEDRPRLMMRSIIAGLIVATATYSSAGLYGEALARPMTLYPQLALALALFAAVIPLLNAKKGRTRKTEFAAAALAAAAVGFAASLSAADAFGYAAHRARLAAYDRAYASIIPEGSLVISAGENMLTRAARAGSAIVSPNPDDIDGIRRTIAAYVEADRCVFVHTSVAFGSVEDARAWSLIDVPAVIEDPDIALYGHNQNPDRCQPF